MCQQCRQQSQSNPCSSTLSQGNRSQTERYLFRALKNVCYSLPENKINHPNPSSLSYTAPQQKDGFFCLNRFTVTYLALCTSFALPNAFLGHLMLTWCKGRVSESKYSKRYLITSTNSVFECTNSSYLWSLCPSINHVHVSDIQSST